VKYTTDNNGIGWLNSLTFDGDTVPSRPGRHGWLVDPSGHRLSSANVSANCPHMHFH